MKIDRNRPMHAYKKPPATNIESHTKPTYEDEAE